MLVRLAIDPGRYAGWALSRDGIVVACGLNVYPNRIRVFAGVDEVVCERPQHYPNMSTKQANDLITLALRAGGLCECACPGVPVTWVLPHAWKCSVPKDMHNVRVLKRLEESEKVLVRESACASLVNNVIDAVGLSLWASKRYTP